MPIKTETPTFVCWRCSSLLRKVGVLTFHLGGQVATAGVEAPDAVLGQGMVWQQGHNRLKGGVTGRTAIADGVVPDISSRDASYYG
ncbi:MAG: hypothetical protein ACRC2U_05760 [Aeromonas sp.]